MDFTDVETVMSRPYRDDAGVRGCNETKGTATPKELKSACVPHHQPYNWWVRDCSVWSSVYSNGGSRRRTRSIVDYAFGRASSWPNARCISTGPAGSGTSRLSEWISTRANELGAAHDCIVPWGSRRPMASDLIRAGCGAVSRLNAN